VSGDLLSVPWRLSDSPDSRGAVADPGGAPVLVVYAQSPAVAEYVTALHNAELGRVEAARDRRERAGRSPWRRAQHWAHARLHPQLHVQGCSRCHGEAGRR